MDGNHHLATEPKARKRSRRIVKLWLKLCAHRALIIKNKWKPHRIRYGLRTTNARIVWIEKAMVTKDRTLSIDTALYLIGKILRSGRLSRNNQAARSLLVGWISEIRWYNDMELRTGSGGSDTEINSSYLLCGFIEAALSGLEWGNRSNIYSTNRAKYRTAWAAATDSYDQNQHHSHLHHPYGVPYHQRNHHYRMEHRKKPSCITGGCATLS